jgi:hypothetical protein
MGRFLGTAKDRYWPKVVSHQGFTSVSFGEISWL